ncbi:MobC family plasmid mobilization relaxosome protein [Tsukamurella spumae]|uniref:MobC family plasmid mobilization relaxosome protein n=1 Tax=Tsukamurella spumae TaxID=44753 RepID=UPI001446215C|nr:MobC family plasmid mobilization relaxosome protein [Tsukamurella spumae]
MVDGDDRDTDVDLEALAAGVIRDLGTAHGRHQPRVHRAVPKALAMRADGVAFAAIGRAVGFDPRTVRRWCAVAERIEPGFAPPRRREAPLSFRPAEGMTEELESMAFQTGVPAADLLRKFTAAGLAMEVPETVPTAPAAVLDPDVVELLCAIRNALGEQSLEARAQGNNVNQLTKFVHTYRELPVSITETIAALATVVEGWSRALDRMADAVTAVAP